MQPQNGDKDTGRSGGNEEPVLRTQALQSWPRSLIMCKGWPGAASSQWNSSIHVGLAAVGSKTV